MVVRNSTTTFLYSTENLPDNTMKLADALTAKNTVISSSFESPKTMRKLCLSTKFSHKEIW